MGSGDNEMDVRYVAHLARLELTPQEEVQFGAQLGQILHYFKALRNLDVSGVEPTAHAMPLVNVTRLDLPQASFPHEEAMRLAPAPSDGLFQVPRIVE